MIRRNQCTHKSKHVRKVASEWRLYCLEVVGEVLVLHGEVHGPLQALVARVHHLPRQARQRLLDVQVVVRVVQVVVPEPVFAEAGGDGVPVEARQWVPARVHEPRREPGEHPREGSGRSRGLVRVLPMIAGVVPESFGFPPSSSPHGVLVLGLMGGVLCGPRRPERLLYCSPSLFLTESLDLLPCPHARKR